MAEDGPRQPDADGAPEVPPSVRTPWGEIRIPDDVSELTAEVAGVRRELRVARWRHRWLRLVRRRDDPGDSGVMGPLLVVVLALTVGIASLFGGFLPSTTDQASGGTRIRDAPQRLPDLTLTDVEGRPVRLARIRPSVILAVARCGCADLIADTAAITGRKGITLLVVDQPVARHLPPTIVAGHPGAVRSLADPQGRLPGSVARHWAPRDGAALVMLVTADGSLDQVIANVRSTAQIAARIDRIA